MVLDAFFFRQVPGARLAVWGENVPERLASELGRMRLVPVRRRPVLVRRTAPNVPFSALILLALQRQKGVLTAAGLD
jgi:hypothetical protein